MPKVPIYQRQVNIQTPNLQTQDVRSNIPAAAFGGEIYQATANIGKNITGIAEKMIEKEERDLKQEALNVDTKFKLELNNRLYNTKQEETVDEKGNVVKKPIGLLNRELNQADGVSIEYDNIYNELKTKYLNNQNERIKPVLENLFATTYVSNRDNVIKHEGNQVNLARDASEKANLEVMQDMAIKNPATDNIISILKEGRGKIFVNDSGRNSEDVLQVKMQKFSDSVATGTVGSLLDNNNYKQADVILENIKDYISPEVYTKSKEKIDEVKLNEEQLGYNVELYAKYGENKAKADTYILNDTKLSGKEKALQLSKYDTFYSMKKEEKNIFENQTVDNIYSQMEQIKNTYGATNIGLEKAKKLVNNAPLDFDKKISLTGVAESVFNSESKRKTDINVWFKVYDDIEKGTLNSISEMRKKYGASLSDADMKAFARSMNGGSDTQKNKYNKWSLSRSANLILKESKIPVEDQAAFWDYNANKIKDAEEKLKRPLSSAEQQQILIDSVKKVTIEKRKLLGWDEGRRDRREEKFKAAAIWADEYNAYIYKDDKGNIYTVDDNEGN